MNFLSQSRHPNGFSPEWLRLWIVSAEELPKHFPHSVHRCFIRCWEEKPGDSPPAGSALCSLWCLASRPAVTNRRWHVGHSCGFSPLWVFRWMMRFARQVNRLLQSMHMKGRSLPSVPSAAVASISISAAQPNPRNTSLHPRLNNIKLDSKGKGKEADLYSAFIKVAYTQGAQVRITQCYLQTTPYLSLPRKNSPDGASQTEVADI